MKISFSKIRFFLISLLLLFLFSLRVTGQVHNNQTYKALLDKIIELKYSNPELAKINALQLLKKAQNEDSLDWEFHAYHQLGRIANIEGDYPNALQSAEKAIEVAKNLNNEEHLFEGVLTKGNALVYLGDNKRALDNYLRSLNIAKKLKNVAFEIRASANAAKVKRRVGQYEEALEMYQNNLKLAISKKNISKTTIINAYMGVGGTYLRLNLPDSTLHYSAIGLQKSNIINDIEGASYFYNDMGMAYFKKKQYKNAINYLKKAEKIILKLNNKARLTETYYFIGKAFYQLKEIDSAIFYLKEVESIVNIQNKEKQSNFNPPELLPTYKLLADIYKELLNKDASSLYIEKYIALDKQNDEHKDSVVKKLFTTKENEVQSLINIASKQQLQLKYLIPISIFILLLLTFFLLKFLKIKKQHKIVFDKLLKSIKEKQERKSKQKQLIIQDEKVKVILERLDKLEEVEYFLNDTCNLQNMAKKVKTNTTYLSKIISTYKHKSFYEYINELRIQYVLKRLKDDTKFRNYSIKHISKEIGYKSANSFTKYFKAHTKLYPSYYIQNIIENHKKTSSN